MKKQNTNDLSQVKLIILYILKNIHLPLSQVQITEIVMKYSLMDYFTLHQYLSDLISINQIQVFEKDDKQLYQITPTGKQMLEYFETRIPFSTREKITNAAADIRQDIKKSTEIVSDYTPRNEHEFVVQCAINENEVPLVEIKLVVGSKSQAHDICKQWQTNAQHIYMQIINSLTEKINTESPNDEKSL